MNWRPRYSWLLKILQNPWHVGMGPTVILRQDRRHKVSYTHPGRCAYVLLDARTCFIFPFGCATRHTYETSLLKRTVQVETLQHKL